MIVIEFDTEQAAQEYVDFANEVCGVLPPYTIVKVYPKIDNPSIFWVDYTSLIEQISSANQTMIDAFSHSGTVRIVENLYVLGHRVSPEEF